MNNDLDMAEGINRTVSPATLKIQELMKRLDEFTEEMGKTQIEKAVHPLKAQ